MPETTPRTVSSKYRGTREYHLVYSELIRAAQYRGTTTYQELAAIMGLPSRGSHMAREVGHLLGEISDDEIAESRPMLSAVAVGVSGEPGSGFFGLAFDFGKLARDASKDERERFWRQECEAVYQTWQPRR